MIIASTDGYNETEINLGNVVIQRFHYDVIDSTQIEARRIHDQITPDKWYLCTSSYQTQGIGQHGRSWASPKNANVLATYGFAFPQELNKYLLCLPQTTALSVIETIEHFGIEANFKWVNDAYVNGAKISGILVEAQSFPQHGGQFFSVLVGIGINVNFQKETLSSIDQPATSLYKELGEYLEVENVISVLSTSLTKNIYSLMSCGFSNIYAQLEPKLEKFDDKAIVFDTEDGSDAPYIVAKISSLGSEFGGLVLENINSETTEHVNGRILRGTQIEPAIRNTDIILQLVREHYYECLDSTQLVARSEYSLVDDGYWHSIRAGYQTNGIGSGSNTWFSVPDQSVLVTYLMPFSSYLSSDESRIVRQITQIAELSVLETLESYGCSGKIRWPNDVLLGGKKVSGSLVEVVHNDGNKAILVGVGINVNQNEEGLREVSQPATSMKLNTSSQENIEIVDVYISLTKKLFYNLHVAFLYGLSKLNDRIESALAYLKHKIVVKDEETQDVHVGIFDRLTEDGCIILSTEDHGEVCLGDGSVLEDLGPYEMVK